MDEKEVQKHVQEKLIMYQLHQKQLEEYQQQLQLIEQKNLEFDGTEQVINDFQKSKQGKNILVQLGSGIYLNGESVPGKLLTDIGAGLIAERNFVAAKKIVHERKKEINRIKDQIKTQIEKVTDQIGKLGQEIEKLNK